MPVALASRSRDALLRWYDRVARDLPWRGLDDPYAVLVCEVMSQQTRIETVIGYWTTWMERFPTVSSLASAAEDDVMAAWAGLGYYRRARNLRRAAAEIVADHDGEIPDTYEGLMALPGVGPYTAGAVASIAFSRSVPAVDGNVTRVVSRLTQTGGARNAAFRRAIREAAATLIDAERPGDSNQALMELGATVCRPRAPLCEECPLAAGCGARLAATTDQYPPPRDTPAPRPESRLAVVPLRGGDAFVRRRPPTGLLAGTWEFPTFEAEEIADAVVTLEERHGIRGEIEFAGEVEHVFSHIRMTYRVWSLQVSVPDSVGGRWVPATDFGGLAISAAMTKVAGCIPTSALT